MPDFPTTPFTGPPSLREARVALVTTAAIHGPRDQPIGRGDQSFRVIEGGTRLFLGHSSQNFDRSGWLADPNVVLPIDRLNELAADGRIGSVGERHLSFAGNQHDLTLSTVRLDSGPAAAKLLRDDGVQVVLITGV